MVDTCIQAVNRDCGLAYLTVHHRLVGYTHGDFVLLFLKANLVNRFSLSVCPATMAFAPVLNRFPFAGLSSVSSGLPEAASLRAKASVLLPGAAWAMKTRWASSATRLLRWAASYAVGRRTAAGKGERTSRRSSSRAVRQSRGDAHVVDATGWADYHRQAAP